MLAVVGEQARVQLRIAGAAHGAGPLGGKHHHFAQLVRWRSRHHGGAQAVKRHQYMHHALAMLKRRRQVLAQHRLIGRVHDKVRHRQLDRVLLEAVDAWKARGRQELPVHAQMGIATRARPVGQFCVDALAVDHQWCKQADMLAPISPEQLRRNAVGRLRAHRRAVLDAMLHAQLDVEQAQEVPDLGGRAHRALAPAARQSLLDRDCRRYAIHGIHFRPPRRLHDAARIGIERLKIPPLPFVEQDVERQRGFS